MRTTHQSRPMRDARNLPITAHSTCEMQAGHANFSCFTDSHTEDIVLTRLYPSVFCTCTSVCRTDTLSVVLVQENESSCVLHPPKHPSISCHALLICKTDQAFASQMRVVLVLRASGVIPQYLEWHSHVADRRTTVSLQTSLRLDLQRRPQMLCTCTHQ